MRRFLIAIGCVYAALAAWGTYRRLWQIQRLEVNVPSSTLAEGAVVSVDVITSGETHNVIRLELVQGDRRETLWEERAEVNRNNTLDPRRFRYTPSVVITRETLQRFNPGHAVLRLTGFGGPKLLRTPAPRVREVGVQLTRP